MEAAVAQLAVIDIRLLVSFPGLLLDPGDFLALRLGLLDFVLDDRNNVLVDSKVVVQIFGDEVIDVRSDGWPSVDLYGAIRILHLLAVPVRLLLFPHIGGTELGLRLTLEVRLLNLYADRSYYALTAVLRSVVLLEEILECLGDGLTESGQMGSSVTGVLAVYERRDVLAVGVAVGQDDLDVLAHKMDRSIARGLGKIVVHKVQKAVLGLVGDSVQDYRQTFLQVGVVLDHRLHIVHMELKASEHCTVRGEHDKCTVLFTDLLLPAAVHKLSTLVAGPGTLSSSERLHVETL